MSVLLGLICCFLISSEAKGSYFEKQPNIIYILSDDLGHADVGFTNGNVETPNLNRLAREGKPTTTETFQFRIICPVHDLSV